MLIIVQYNFPDDGLLGTGSDLSICLFVLKSCFSSLKELWAGLRDVTETECLQKESCQVKPQNRHICSDWSWAGSLICMGNRLSGGGVRSGPLSFPTGLFLVGEGALQMRQGQRLWGLILKGT